MRDPRRTLLGFSPFHWGPGAPPDVISSDFQNEHRRPLLTLKHVCAGAGVGETCFVGFGNTILRGLLGTGRISLLVLTLRQGRKLEVLSLTYDRNRK